MKLWKSLSIVSAAILLTGCAALTPPSKTGPSPLVIASCPELTPLSNDTFGATALKLIEVAGQYYKCRAAALQNEKSP